MPASIPFNQILALAKKVLNLFQVVIDDLHSELFLNGFFHKCQRSVLVSVVAEKQDVTSVTKTARSNQIKCIMRTCMQYVSELLTKELPQPGSRTDVRGASS